MSEENRVNQIDVKQVSDGELMELYKSGRIESFQILYNRHSAKVYGYFRGRLKNRAQADDLFQATFLKLHSHRQKYDSSLPFLPWLFAISQSVLMDFFRKAGRDQNLVQALEEVVPDMSVEETGSGVSIHLEGLPEREKTALTLRYENECSFEEIAERLNTTSPNARKIVSRAIKTLRAGGGSHGK